MYSTRDRVPIELFKIFYSWTALMTKSLPIKRLYLQKVVNSHLYKSITLPNLICFWLDCREIETP